MQDFTRYGCHIMQNNYRSKINCKRGIDINYMKKYKKLDLEAALLEVENGASHKEVANGSLNKSIIAREMRKRKNK